MPFGLTNAPPTFQRNMNEIFKEDLYKHVLIFLDDVLTFSKTPEEHLEHLEKVFRGLRKAGLRLKPKKCNLFRTEVDCLCHVINKEEGRNPTRSEKVSGSPRMGTSNRRHRTIIANLSKTSRKMLGHFIC